MATNYLTRSGATPTSEKIATMSAWVKVNDSAGSIGLFAQTASSSGNGVMFFINASSQLEFYCTNGSSQAARVVTNRVLRDTNAWYLLQCQIDTTQASNINRVKMFINGEQIADSDMSIASYPSQNINLNGFDGSGNQIFGSLDNLSYNCKADIADAYFIDGSIIASNQFWSTDSTTGEIKPNTSPTISSFGANGYHLKFENANQGLDSKPSGASNFTTNGTIRKQEDNPSNNFCTLNDLKKLTGTLSNGNTTWTASGDNGIWGTIGANSGKWYWETKMNNSASLVQGIASEDVTQATDRVSNAGVYGIQDGTSYGYYANNGSRGQSTGFPNPSSSNTICHALDLDNGKYWVGVNGSYYQIDGTAGNPSTDTNPTYTGIDTTKFWFPFLECRGASASGSANFGNGYMGTTAISSEGTNASGIGKFEYDVPTGFTALSTKGLNE